MRSLHTNMQIAQCGKCDILDHSFFPSNFFQIPFLISLKNIYIEYKTRLSEKMYHVNTHDQYHHCDKNRQNWRRDQQTR